MSRSSSHSFGPSQWAFKHSLACHKCFFTYLISFPPLISHFEHGCFTFVLIKLSIDWGLEESLSTPSINLHLYASSISQLRFKCKGALYKCVLLVSWNRLSFFSFMVVVFCRGLEALLWSAFMAATSILWDFQCTGISTSQLVNHGSLLLI